jgi:hypothetical protein
MQKRLLQDSVQALSVTQGLLPSVLFRRFRQEKQFRTVTTGGLIDMWMDDKDFYGMLIVVALCGWAAIEGTIWLFSHLQISWVW